MKLLIGITGGIGSGKSAVTQDLRSRGEYVICADETAREVVLPGQSGNLALRAEYGDAYFDAGGMLNRKKLASHVFGYPERVERLNSLLHPVITGRMFELANDHEGRVFLDAALLIQSGMHDRVDFVWLVVADIETRVRRVMLRDSISRDEVLKRINSQMSDDDIRQYADEVIENDGSLEELHKRISAVINKPDYVR
jgi:dephospho-CoA kinase